MITIEELHRLEQEEQNKWDAFRYSDLATGDEPENYQEYRYNKMLMDTMAEYVLSGKYAEEDKKKSQVSKLKQSAARGRKESKVKQSATRGRKKSQESKVKQSATSDRIISNPVCAFCGKQYSPDSIVYENSEGFCFCSIECILKSKGFKPIKWSDKYKIVE